jgi:hypothetical protein
MHRSIQGTFLYSIVCARAVVYVYTEDKWKTQNHMVLTVFSLVQLNPLFDIYVFYSTLVLLPPFRLICAGGCWH